MGIPLAVITNKATRFVRPHLVAAGIERFFSVVIGGDDLPTKKPDPGPLRHVAALLGIPPGLLLMVGDSGNDVEAARGAGCPVLVVPYGYREGRPVHELGADGIVAVGGRARRSRPLRRPHHGMSFDLFSRPTTAATARWPARLSPPAGGVRIDRPPLALTSVSPGVARRDAPRSLPTAPPSAQKRLTQHHDRSRIPRACRPGL